MATKNSGNTSFVFIFLTVLIDMIGIGIIIPIMPDLIVSLTGQSLSEAAVTGALLMTTYAGMQVLFAPVMGELSDRFGRKPILLLALFGLGLDYVIHAFSPTIAWLFLGRIIAGLFGASHSVAMAYIADISTKENKAKNFGLIGAAFGLGFFIGPGIGGIVAAEWGVKAPFFAAATFSLLNCLFGIFFLKESLPTERRRKVDFKRMIPFASLVYLSKYKAVLGFVSAFALVQLAGQVMPVIWTFYTKESFNWSAFDNGISLMVVGLLVSAVQAGLTGYLVKTLGNRKVIIYGFLSWTLGMLCITFASSTLLLYLSLLPYLLGGIAGPTIQGLVSNSVSEKEQGNLQGLLTSLGSLTAIVAPFIYSTLFSVYTAPDASYYFPGAPFLLGGIILIVASVVALRSLKTLTPTTNSQVIDDEEIIAKSVNNELIQ